MNTPRDGCQGVLIGLEFSVGGIEKNDGYNARTCVSQTIILRSHVLEAGVVVVTLEAAPVGVRTADNGMMPAQRHRGVSTMWV